MIMDTSGFQYLKTSLPKAAWLKSDPVMLCFNCSNNNKTWSVNVLNHTSLKLEIEKDGSFYVDNHQGINGFQDFCHLIFYCLEGYPNLLCLEKQDACMYTTRFFTDLKDPDIALKPDREGTIHELSEKIYKKNAPLASNQRSILLFLCKHLSY